MYRKHISDYKIIKNTVEAYIRPEKECWRELYYLVNYLINQQKFITNVITY